MYKKAYLSAGELTDAIMRGEYYGEQEELPTKKKGISNRPVTSQEEPESNQDIMMQYFLSMRKQGEELQEALQAPQTANYDSGGYTPKLPVVGDVGRAREAVGWVESKGNYKAVGPVVEKGRYAGQRAYGKYQVMEGNIGPWTQEVIGRAVSKEEFINSPGIQDKVAEQKLQQSYKKFGTWEDAASVWFTGRPVAKNQNDNDGYTTANQYVQNFQTAWGRFS